MKQGEGERFDIYFMLAQGTYSKCNSGVHCNVMYGIIIQLNLTTIIIKEDIIAEFQHISCCMLHTDQHNSSSVKMISFLRLS